MKGAIRDGVEKADAFGLGQDPPSRPVLLQVDPDVRETLNRLRSQIRDAQIAGNLDRARELARSFISTPGRFNFPRDSQKLQAFSGWLDEMIDTGVMSVERNAAGEIAERAGWQQTFVKRSYVKGISSADVKLREAGVDVAPRFDNVERTIQLPIHQESLELLYSRNLEELKGISEAASQEMRRELAEGFARGQNPRRTATFINRRVDAVGLTRSRTLARTETIRAHAKSTISRFRQFGVTKVTGKAEFATAGDDRVCPICIGLEGEIFTLEEAEPVIPVHPNCRCTWLPVTPTSQRNRRLQRNEDRVRDILEAVERVQAETFPDWLRRAA